VKRLVGSPVGTCVPITGYDHRFGEDYETHAFVPRDLPSELDLPNEVWIQVTEAMTELGRLDAAAALIPNPALVTRIATRREAIGTSALEGTFANLTDLFAAEALPADDGHGASIPPNVREVMNYTRAADAGYAWVVDRPVTMTLLSSLQALIISGSEADGPEAGQIREKQVFIGAQSRRISEARFVPPPPGDQLRRLFESWLQWLTDPRPASNIQIVARVAMAHYQFETIHPYTDGNGRLGRLVSVLQFLREGVLRSPVLSVSPWLKDHATEYRDQLLEVSRTGDWAPWVRFFAQAVAAQSKDGHERIMRLLELRQEIGEAVRTALPKARLAVEIADDLIAYPILTVAAAHSRHGRTNEANRNAIQKLVEIGVLEPYTEARYDRMFWNRRVFQIIDA
jgi:Fic family protein